MASHTAASAPPTAGVTREERRVLAGTLVGTSIGWYACCIYA